MAQCKAGEYYDDVVDRCQDCREICYGSYLNDKSSDCSRFCPAFLTPEFNNGLDPSSLARQLGVTEIILIAVSTAVLVSLMVGIMVYWLRRGGGTPHKPPTIPVQAEEVALTDLHIPTYDNYPTDSLLDRTTL